MDAFELWDTVRGNMKQQIGKPSFDTWIETIEVLALDGENLILQAETEFHKQ